jgi:hypothetical protein
MKTASKASNATRYPPTVIGTCGMTVLLIALVLATVLSVGFSTEVSASTALHECMLAGDRDGESASMVAAQRVFVQFMSCVNSQRPDSSELSCNTFTATALEAIYPSLPILRVQHSDGTWMTTQELGDTITRDTATWQRLGKAGDQATLNKAQARAENGRAVVAVSQGPLGEHHAVIILPGPRTPSPRWHGLTAPNSVSFAHRSPHRSYVGCPLSYGFRQPDGVMLYTQR